MPEPSSMTAVVCPGQASDADVDAVALRRWVPDLVAVAPSLAGCDIERPPEGPIATQVRHFAATVAAWRSWREHHGPAHVVAGHSLGEVAAAVVAGAMPAQDGLWFVSRRATHQQTAVGVDDVDLMAFVGHRDAILARIARHGSLSLANDNAPDQIVIAGPRDDLRGLARSLPRSTRAVFLGLGAGYHTDRMAPAVVALRWEAGRLGIEDAQSPIISASTARPVCTAENVRSLLVDGIASPVRWPNVVHCLVRAGVTDVVSIGPTPFLVKLTKTNAPQLRVIHVQAMP